MITVVGNLKGGSGKSTVAFNLAVWLARHNHQVTVFDLDPQQTLTDVAEVRVEEGITPQFLLHHGGEAQLEVIQATEGEVVVDIGTADMKAMRGALALAQRIVIPVAPSQADVWSTQRFLSIIAKIFADSDYPEVLAFVNRADTHQAIRESDEAEAALESLEGVQVIKSRLHQRTAYRRSFSEGHGVFEVDSGSKAASEFRAFVAHLYPQFAENT
ncbi:MAG: AAA family ATPase [Gammaproteobacteria bacterium]|nr:AAA family ATPase [Gammaproteobacteria bacterium]